MFRRRAAAAEQRPRQQQIADLKRMHPSIIAHPDGMSFDLPVHTATTRFLLLIRLPDEFPVMPPSISVSVIGIAHRLLAESTVIHPQLSSGWDPQTPLGGLVKNIVNEFVENPPSILVEMASNRSQLPLQQQDQSNVKDKVVHSSSIALPPIPREIEELKRLSPEQLLNITRDEEELDNFVQKLPLWTAILSLRQSLEEEVSKVAMEHLEHEKQIEELRREIVCLQSEVRDDLIKWDAVHQRQQEICSRSSPATVASLLQDKADRVDSSCEELHAQYNAGLIPEDEFIKQYRQKRVQYHRLMVYSERLLNRR